MMPFDSRAHFSASGRVSLHLRYPKTGYETVSLCQIEITDKPTDPEWTTLDKAAVCPDCRWYVRNMGHPWWPLKAARKAKRRTKPMPLLD